MCGCRFRRWAILTGRRGLGKVLLGAVLLGRVLLGGVLLGGSAWLGGAVGTVEAAVEETVAGAVEGSALVEAAAAGVCTLRAAIFPPLLLLLVQLSPELEPLTASAEDREASVAEAGGVEAGEEWSGKVIWKARSDVSHLDVHKKQLDSRGVLGLADGRNISPIDALHFSKLLQVTPLALLRCTPTNLFLLVALGAVLEFLIAPHWLLATHVS
ncbi:unnamed protein product [Closterium sp. NIES-65]|nr:unnamed protein product [Closterium sp. NIES-65]